jgi:hypothetical protein
LGTIQLQTPLHRAAALLITLSAQLHHQADSAALAGMCRPHVGAWYVRNCRAAPAAPRQAQDGQKTVRRTHPPSQRHDTLWRGCPAVLGGSAVHELHILTLLLATSLLCIKRSTLHIVECLPASPPVHKCCHDMTLQCCTEGCMVSVNGAAVCHPSPTSRWLLQPLQASTPPHKPNNPAVPSHVKSPFPSHCTSAHPCVPPPCRAAHTHCCTWPCSRSTCAWMSSCSARRTRCTASWALLGQHATQVWTAYRKQSSSTAAAEKSQTPLTTSGPGLPRTGARNVDSQCKHDSNV